MVTTTTATLSPQSTSVASTAHPSASARHRQRRAGWLLLLLALLLYGATLDNGLQPEELVGGDLITHQYAQVQARPSNAPGYPLYTMGGWLWFHTGRMLLHELGIELPNPIALLSSYSTLWALLALWLLYQLLCRLTRSGRTPAGNWPLAWLLTLFYATTYFFWYYATTTEQYSSAIAQTLAIVFVYLQWREQVQAAIPATGRLLWLAFLCGLSLAHMLTVAFIVPGLVAVVLWEAPWLLRRGWVVLGTIVAAFLPLVSYLYVYWRGISHPEWWGQGEWSSGTAWFWAFVSTAQGREELGWGFSAGCQFFANGFPTLIGQELSWLLVGLGVIGLIWLDRRLATLLWSTLLLYLAFAWAYRCGNWFQVILPAYALLLLGSGALLHAGQQVLAARVSAKGIYRLTPLAVTILILPVLWNLNRNWTAADSRNRANDSAFDRAALLLAQPLPPNAPLFAAVNDALALQYLTTIWGVRPDLQVVSSQSAADLLAQERAVYSTWEAAPTLRAELPPALAHHVEAVDPAWLRFAAQPSATPPSPAIQLDQEITAEITLVGYTFTASPRSALAEDRPPLAAATAGVELTLFWQVDKGHWPAEVAISVRPTHGGEMISDGKGGYLQQDRSLPALGLTQTPTSLRVDPYGFGVSGGGQTLIDGARVVLYRQTASGFENLAVLQLMRPQVDQ